VTLITGSKAAMIELSNISKIFNAGRASRFTALREIDLTLATGRVTVFKGPSGSGKTTLLSIIGCMARPTSGRVRVKGWDVTALPERFLSRVRRDSFGFVFQNFNLVSGVTVLENVMLPAYPTARTFRDLKDRALLLLEALEIPAKMHQPVQSLSGGEQQRTAIARALINDPEFIIADEPTAHLDTDLALQFLDIMANLKDQGKTLLLASHDPMVFNSPVADRVIELRYGRMVEEM
jgi:putative ABC transport system ATP-binding protein